ncbi:MAG: hypothetical protein QOI98_1933, partial [Solirubrobacteraceae bacterium]|nr:hypothetical protein [Solirubrobacteraceae bacterium]
MSALLAAATLALTACSLGGRAAPVASTTTSAAERSTSASGAPASPGFTPEPIAWTSCGGRLQCATLTVPLDYADPTGPKIELSLNKLPARKPDQRIGALLVNPGGPGASGVEFVAGGVDVRQAVLERFDIIGFDPRGVGASTPLPCGDTTVPTFRHVDSTPDTPEEQAALDAAAKAVATDCGANAGDLLAHVGTDDVVRDMDTIRLALGESQINYLGISYGSLLGLRYAQLFPQSARAIAVDGVIDPTQDLRSWL